MNVAPLFPAEIDRFRLLQHIAWWGRKKAGLEQKKLAHNARVHQSSISHLEHLKNASREVFADVEDVALRKRLRLSRDSFIQIFSWGLEFPRADIDALLWLYGEHALTARDIKDFVKGYEPDAEPREYTEEDYGPLRRRVLGLLKETLGRLVQDDTPYQATVNIVFFEEQRDRLKADQMLRDLEAKPGQRLLMKQYPSYLTHPKEALESGGVDDPTVVSPSEKQKLHAINVERWELFRRNLSLYGERNMHHRPSLERYLCKDFDSRYSLEQRRKQIENWVELLSTHEHYEAGLTDMCTDFDVEIKSTECAMIGASRDRDEKTGWGPRYVWWSDKPTVLSFFLAFERHWDEIPVEWRMKANVIESLEKLLKNS